VRDTIDVDGNTGGQRLVDVGPVVMVTLDPDDVNVIGPSSA
jgi:hypothetical protein